MLKAVLHFRKHCSCHLQGGSVMARHFYIGQNVEEGMEWIVLIGGVEERAAIQ
jgi:hypothetical protein